MCQGKCRHISPLACSRYINREQAELKFQGALTGNENKRGFRKQGTLREWGTGSTKIQKAPCHFGFGSSYHLIKYTASLLFEKVKRVSIHGLLCTFVLAHSSEYEDSILAMQIEIVRQKNTDQTIAYSKSIVSNSKYFNLKSTSILSHEWSTSIFFVMHIMLYHALYGMLVQIALCYYTVPCRMAEVLFPNAINLNKRE